MNKITRRTATKLKLKKYFTGKLCKNGHVNYRYTKSGVCVSCIYESRKTVPKLKITKLTIKIANEDRDTVISLIRSINKTRGLPLEIKEKS